MCLLVGDFAEDFDTEIFIVLISLSFWEGSLTFSTDTGERERDEKVVKQNGESEGVRKIMEEEEEEEYEFF